jgi:hypothetical protein
MLAVGMVAFDATAADYPTTGMLYNQQEDSSLTYNCTLQAGQQRLRCEFIQTAVRKKAKPADLEKKLGEAQKKYPGAVKEFSDPKECNIVGAWFGMATGQISIDAALARNPKIATDAAKFKEGMIRLQEDAKANPNVLDTFRALAGMCDHPTEENFLKITKAAHDKDLRTWQVSSNPFTQKFVWVSDFGNGAHRSSLRSRRDLAVSSSFLASRRINRIAQVCSGGTLPGRPPLIHRAPCYLD